MNEQKSLIMHIAEWYENRKNSNDGEKRVTRWLPSPGNILFTLLIAGLLILTQRAWANSSQSANTPGPSATTINYQGRLADDAGNPQTGTLGMSFAIWDAANGGGIIWGPESHSAVPVTDGLFNVGLGSQTSGGIPTTVWNGDRYLEITVSGETLTPRELIRSVPVAGMALTAQTALVADTALTVPDGSIEYSKLNLSSGTACRSGNLDINFTGGGYVYEDIPELLLNINMPQSGRVLVWMDGLARYNATSGESGITLNLNETGLTSSLAPQQNWWFGVNGQRIIDMSSGDHTLKAKAYSNTQGIMTIHGSGQHRICINYLVLGQ